MHRWLGLTWVDWFVVFVFIAGITFLGARLYTRVRDRADFFMGGRRFGKIFMMFFAFGTGTGSNDAISVVAGSWRAGLAGIWWAFLWLWSTPFYWLVAPVMRRMRALTTSDFFEARYGSRTATLYSIYGIVMSIAILAGGLYSSGKMINALTGGELNALAQQIDWRVPHFEWNSATAAVQGSWRQVEGFELAILAMTVLFVIYGVAGGLGAAIITDFIQGQLTLVFSFLLLPWVFGKIGGLSGLRAHGEIKEGMFDLFGRPEIAQALGTEPLTIFYVVMLSLTGLAGVVVQPHVMSLCGAGKTEMEGRFGFTFGHLIKRVCTIAWTFTGLACIVWYLTPELSPLDRTTRERLTPDRSVQVVELVQEAAVAKVPFDEASNRGFADELFGRVAYDIFSNTFPGLLGLMLVAALAVTMSTADSHMIVASGLFTQNLYKPLLARDRSEQHYLRVGRVASLAVVFLALALQTTFADVIEALKFVIKLTAPIGISLWVGIVWRGWTPVAVWVSSMAAYGTWAFAAYFPQAVAQSGIGHFMLIEVGGQVKVADSWTMFLYLTAGVLSGILVSLITPRTPKRKLDHFFLLLRTPIKPGEKAATPCTLPPDPLPPEEKWLNHPDIELPKPSMVGIGGFFLAWVAVGLIVWLPFWLSRSPW